VSVAEQILISLEARHAENILQGRKLVEFRRRSMNVEAGATIWIYSKLPVGSIVGCATVAAVRRYAPSTLWRKFGPHSGISRAEFFEYFAGVTQGVALELTDCRRLRASVPLESLRRFSAGFQPPQFFARLKQGAPLLAAISQAGTRLGAAASSSKHTIQDVSAAQF
jgi:predicted transcriptional regulator